MVRITEELVRKKSEHNELLITTLEEISLHQEDIEKIENIQNWCRHLRILLFQNNLIAKIENLHKLKKLEYLNLAINNIEKIENLEKLESLEKLDLTLNFIGELTSVESLRGNYNLKNLILTGNPCTDFKGYRAYVVTVLMQLEILDGKEITRTERLIAVKKINGLRKNIVQQEAKYKIERDQQKIRVEKNIKEQEEKYKDLDTDEQLKRFWEEKSEHCPEIRYEISKNQKKCRTIDVEEKKENKFQRKLFANCGRPYSINEPKIEFDIADEADRYELNLHVYKFLDTSFIEVDVQPKYVRVTLKGKIFQMGLNDEVKISESTSHRSMITGYLLIVMPKLKYIANAVVSAVKTMAIQEKKKMEITGTVDYKNIIKKSNTMDEKIDESEIPPLI